MAERINELLPHLDPVTVGTTAADQLKKATESLVPVQATPLSNFDQLRITGATSKGSDVLRLEPIGKLTSTQVQMMHLARAIDRVKQPSQHPFSAIERNAASILEMHLKYMTQIVPELSHGRT